MPEVGGSKVDVNFDRNKVSNKYLFHFLFFFNKDVLKCDPADSWWHYDLPPINSHNYGH